MLPVSTCKSDKKKQSNSLSYDLYYVLDNQTLSRPLYSKLKKIQGLFKDLLRNLRTFQGKREFIRTFQDCAYPISCSLKTN